MVIIVLGLLAALVGPQILGRVSEAKSGTAKTQIELLGTALDNYKLDNGSYPTTEQGLSALETKPARDPVPLDWRGPYLKRDVPADPWGASTSTRVLGTTTRPRTTSRPWGGMGSPAGVTKTRTLRTGSSDRCEHAGEWVE